MSSLSAIICVNIRKKDLRKSFRSKIVIFSQKYFGEIDILRSLQSISGVTNTGEGASGFNVRGGNTDQNLILQDGQQIVRCI